VAAAFGGASAALWLVYLGLLGALDGIEWQAEIWLGAVVLNALAASAVAVMPTLHGSRAQTLVTGRGLVASN
jgi:hypothetical protein